MTQEEQVVLGQTQKSGRHRRRGGNSNRQMGADPITSNTPALPVIDAGVVAHQRQTLPTNANILGSFPYAFLPRRQYQSVDLSSINVSALSPQQLVDLLSDADPDVSLAWWNFLLLACGSWIVKVRTPDDQEDPIGQKLMQDLLPQINRTWGGFDNLLYQWTMSILLEGACCGETIPQDDFKGTHDIVAVTPWTIYFQRDARQDLIVYQWQPMIANGLVNSFYEPPTIANVANATYGAAGFRLLNTQTFAYVPFMPMVDDPYGRMPFASVFQVIVFDNQLLQDLRRWAHVNAWGRIDVSVLQDRVQSLMPAAVKANPPDAIKFINQYLGDVAKAYNNIGPDDTFIHYDNVVLGSVDATGKTLNIDNLIRAIERKKFRALRMLPILMGSNEGTTETHGTVQWDIMARGIQSIQKGVVTLANTLLTVALRLAGSTSHALLDFEQIRTTDRMADAQAEAVVIKNEALKRDQGWITQDDASIAVTGTPAVAKAPDPDSLIAPTMSPPIEGDFSVTPKPSPPQAKKPGAAKTGKQDAPADDDEDELTKSFLVDAIQEELTRATLDGIAHVETPAAHETHVRTKKKTRKDLTEALTAKVAAHFRQTKVSTATVRKIVDAHTSRNRFRSNARHLPEDFYEGARVLIALRSGDQSRILLRQQRAALKASIANMLSDDIPDTDADFQDDIDEARLDAYNIGGQDGLETIQFDGYDFNLTNAAILATLAAYAVTSVSSSQSTTRDQLATTILSTLEDGGDVGTVSAAITARLEQMTETRAPTIAGFLVDSGYWTGTSDSWANNGVTHKTWVTDGDPDPNAGATGETPCRDNAYASPIGMDETFPDGSDCPPAHGSCKCDLAPASDPSDAAKANPWTGGDLTDDEAA